MENKSILYPIMLNSPTCVNFSLYFGLSGALIYLFEVDSYDSNDIIYDLACETVINIIERFPNDMSDYPCGNAGLARCLKYLDDMGYVDVPSTHKVFLDLDNAIFKNNTSVDLSLNSCGITAYVLERFDLNLPNRFEQLLRKERIIAHLDAIEKFLETPLILRQHFRDIFELSGNTDFLESELEKLSHAVYLLLKVSNVEPSIYPSNTSKCLSALSVRLNYFYESLLGLFSEDRFLRDDMLDKLVIVYLELLSMKVNLTSLTGKEFEAVNHVINLLSLKNYNRVKGYSSLFPQCIVIYQLLNKIKNMDHSASLENYLRDLLDSNLKQVENYDYDFKYKTQLNIGLATISGLGMVRLGASPRWLDLLLKI